MARNNAQTLTTQVFLLSLTLMLSKYQMQKVLNSIYNSLLPLVNSGIDFITLYFLAVQLPSATMNWCLNTVIPLTDKFWLSSNASS